MEITLARARQRVGLSRRELALLAGVAPSTIGRIEAGVIEPTVATLNRLLAVTGTRSEVVDTPSDPLAIAAVRCLLEGRVQPLTTGWIERFAKLGWIDEDDKPKSIRLLCERAARFSAILRRPGARAYRNEWQTASILSRLASVGVDAAATCGFAMEQLDVTDTSGWNVIYVSDISVAETSLELKEYGRLEGAPLVLLPFDGFSELGAVDGYASPLQVLLDCYSGPGRMTDMADVLADRWDKK